MTSLPFASYMLAADVALAIAAVAGLAAAKMLRPVSVPDMPAAFGLLERAIQKYIPDLPPGYTWHEAVERLKRSGVEANWSTIQERLAAYEAFRYGGGAPPASGKDEVVSLALEIRGLVIGKRAER